MNLPDPRNPPSEPPRSERFFPGHKKPEGQGALLDDGRSPFAEKGEKGEDEHTESEDEETQ